MGDTESNEALSQEIIDHFSSSEGGFDPNLFLKSLLPFQSETSSITKDELRNYVSVMFPKQAPGFSTFVQNLGTRVGDQRVIKIEDLLQYFQRFFRTPVTNKKVPKNEFQSLYEKLGNLKRLDSSGRIKASEIHNIFPGSFLQFNELTAFIESICGQLTQKEKNLLLINLQSQIKGNNPDTTPISKQDFLKLINELDSLSRNESPLSGYKTDGSTRIRSLSYQPNIFMNNTSAQNPFYAHQNQPNLQNPIYGYKAQAYQQPRFERYNQSPHELNQNWNEYLDPYLNQQHPTFRNSQQQDTLERRDFLNKNNLFCNQQPSSNFQSPLKNQFGQRDGLNARHQRILSYHFPSPAIHYQQQQQNNNHTNNNNNNNRSFSLEQKQQNLQQQPQIIPQKKKQNPIFPIDNQIINKNYEGDYYEQIYGDFELPGYEEFVLQFESCSANQHQFYDYSFPPSEDSIHRNKDHSQYEKFKKLLWFRPKHMFNSKSFSMFDNVTSMTESRTGLKKIIHPNDIQQGMLGDCYFLSTLSCLAQEPERILKLFITRTVNPYGIYCIQICHDGEWRAITLDDNIPCHRDATPAFTKTSGNAIWVVLIEKAWAKLFRNYQKIEAGHCEEALRDLTGAPTMNLLTYSEVTANGIVVNEINQDLMPILTGALDEKEKFLVTTINDSQDLSKSQANLLGLITSHAYSVLGIYSIFHPSLGSVQLLKLRNPWGKKEWNGDWSDRSSLWTDDLRKQLKMKNQTDGIFFMNLNDFYKYFSMVTICYVHDHFLYSSLKFPASSSRHSNYTFLTIKQKGTYYVSIVQPNKRNFSKQTDFKYSVGRLFIAQIQDANGKRIIRYVGSIQKKGREIFYESNLDEGIYMIEAKLKWLQNNSTSFVISTYGVAHTQLQLANKQEIPGHLREECLKQFARRNVSSTTIPIKHQQIEKSKGFGYYYIQNTSSSVWNLNLYFNQQIGFKLQKPFRGNQASALIPPNSDFILILKVDYVRQISMRYKESITNV